MALVITAARPDQMIAQPPVAPSDTAQRIEFETLLTNSSARLVSALPGQLHEAVQSAVDAVRSLFDADRCGLLSVDNEQVTVHVAFASYSEGIAGPGPDVNLAERFPWVRHRVAVERKPAVISRLDDLPPEAAVDRASFEAMPTKSSLVVPIEVEPGALYLVVIGSTRRQIDWPAEYVSRVKLLGELLVGAIVRDEALARAREEAARVEAAVDAAGLGFFERVPGVGITYFDPGFGDIMGVRDLAPSDAEAFWLAHVHEESREEVEQKRRLLVTGGLDRLTVEYRYEHPTRGSRWLRHSSRRFAGGASDPVRIVGAVEDVTERHRALEEVQRLRERLERENVYLRQEAQRHGGSDLVVGRSAAIRATLALAERVAPTDATVLLLGETGVGKERLASYIHEFSRRRGRPMIRVNCSAIPTTLIESELFGREKGAYTGALSKQIGRFELANGSTLFLDEIGDLPSEVQVKLLRVLEERTIERLGNPRPVPIDVRIIAATHRDLEREVDHGRFREDLYYRLRVFPISVPPLRERREDIPLLIDAMLDELAGSMGRRVDGVDPASLGALVDYAWPGNVRELRNVVEHALIMATGSVLHINPPRRSVHEVPPTSDLASLEKGHILKVLHDTGWRIRGDRGAAARLGLKPTTLESRMKKLGLSRPGAN